jgi:hypothetical protein
MYRFTPVFLITAILLPELVVAGPREGVAAEFRAVEESIRKRKHDPAILQKTLEDNLVRAMRAAIRRRFYEDQNKYLEGLTAENITWEKTFSDNVYFVKFRYFIVRFDFARNPELFIQSPVYEKFLLMDGFEGDSHRADSPAKPQ